MASISAEAAGKHIIVIGLSLEQTRSQYCSTEKILKLLSGLHCWKDAWCCIVLQCNMHGNAELLSISKGYGVSGGQHTFIKPLICCWQGACSQCFQDNESYILSNVLTVVFRFLIQDTITWRTYQYFKMKSLVGCGVMRDAIICTNWDNQISRFSQHQLIIIKWSPFCHFSAAPTALWRFFSSLKASCWRQANLPNYECHLLQQLTL